MKFEEVLPALRDGKKIGRKKWNKGYYYRMTYKYGHNVIVDNYDEAKEDWENLLADDWEIIKEPPKKVKLRDLTKEQYTKWRKKHCVTSKCGDCIFKRIYCLDDQLCWTNDKSLFSDKFLDQEIEVEE